ncbi:hypothetical protein [Poriferisphaera sp. WC338]|uniref:hypothetical protein n=1 Tax=Poriferisphaera sp. WC338 TaxID=3425129 RepID=UPI003D81473F
MSAPDFYFAINDIFRHIHDVHGKDRLIDYWESLGREHYAKRNTDWKTGGPEVVVNDWRNYFAKEPGAEVEVSYTNDEALLDIRVCPAIKHLRDQQRDIVPYFCEHCDHICGAQAEAAGYRFKRSGGMGSCRQRFIQLRHPNENCTGTAKNPTSTL